MAEQVSTDDAGYLYGDGLFETVRLIDGKALFLERHIRRFRRSATWLGYTAEVIEQGVQTLRSLTDRRDGLWRVTITRPMAEGPGGGRSVTVRWREVPYENGDDGPGPTLAVVENFYFPQFELAEHKTTSWLRSLQARRRAKQRGFDEALMVSPAGRVGEAAAANIFLRIAGQWVTPPIEGILPGVVREALLEAARECGVSIAQRPVYVGDLQTCESIVLTSTARLITAAKAVEEQILETEYGQELRDAFFAYLK